jgi:hypothetical protein
MEGPAPYIPQGVGQQCLPLELTEEVDLHLRIVATSNPRLAITAYHLGVLQLRRAVEQAAVIPRVAGHEYLP